LIDFGIARAVDTQTFGEPGQRTFRVRALGSASGTVWLWAEKEHLRALSFAFRRILSGLKYEGRPGTAVAEEIPEAADHEIRVGIIGVGFDESAQTVVLQVHELGLGEDDQPTLRIGFTLEQCSGLAAQIDEIVAAGRPLCPLCALPMDAAGHACVRQNGRSKEAIPDPEQ
jgi:uncharacterized repeat protein (TIGR03847 family)